MTPPLAMDDLMDERLAHSISRRNRLDPGARAAHVANFPYLPFAEFGVAYSLSPHRAAFGNCVTDVLEASSGEEMVGPAARRVVAAMADIQPLGDRPIGQHIRQAMGAEIFLALPHEDTAPIIPALTLPFPAAVRFLDLVPKGRFAPTIRNIDAGSVQDSANGRIGETDLSSNRQEAPTIGVES